MCIRDREKRAHAVYSASTWQPFRGASDLVRTAVETTYVARKDFLKIVYNDFPQSPVYLGAFAGNLAMRMPSSLLVMLGPFLVAHSHPRCKIFDTDAKDDDIIAFFFV